MMVDVIPPTILFLAILLTAGNPHLQDLSDFVSLIKLISVLPLWDMESLFAPWLKINCCTYLKQSLEYKQYNPYHVEIFASLFVLVIPSLI